jgi:hypothetical protein
MHVNIYLETIHYNWIYVQLYKLYTQAILKQHSKFKLSPYLNNQIQAPPYLKNCIGLQGKLDS